jgi:hypothetical protein
MSKQQDPRKYLTGRASFAGYRPSRDQLAVKIPGSIDVIVEQHNVNSYQAYYAGSAVAMTGLNGLPIQGPIDQVIDLLFERFERIDRKFTWCYGDGSAAPAPLLSTIHGSEVSA